jgi:hypothetical protein
MYLLVHQRKLSLQRSEQPLLDSTLEGMDNMTENFLNPIVT